MAASLAKAEGTCSRLHQVWHHREPRRRRIGHGDAKDECQEKQRPDIDPVCKNQNGQNNSLQKTGKLADQGQFDGGRPGLPERRR